MSKNWAFKESKESILAGSGRRAWSCFWRWSFTTARRRYAYVKGTWNVRSTGLNMANVFWILRWHVIGDHFISFWDVVLAQNFAQCFFVYTELVWWTNPRASSTWLRLKFPIFSLRVWLNWRSPLIFGSHQSTNWPSSRTIFASSSPILASQIPFLSWGKTLISDKTLKSGKSTVFLHLNSVWQGEPLARHRTGGAIGCWDDYRNDQISEFQDPKTEGR